MLQSFPRRRGQSMPEYMLIIFLVVILIVASVGVLGATVGGLFNGVVATINSTIGGGEGGGPGPGGGGPPAGVVLLSDSAPTVDQTIIITGAGFAPGHLVTASLHPDPATVLGTATADSIGNVKLTVLIPANVVLESHTVTLDGTAPGGSGVYSESSSNFSVVASPIHLSVAGNSSPLYSGNYSLATFPLSSTVSGSTGPLAYAWKSTNGFASSAASPSASLACTALPDSVSLVVTDGAGHHGRAALSLDACPSPITLSLSAGTPTFSSDYGSVSLPLTASADGGSGGLAYGWSGPHLLAGSSQAAPTLDFTCSPTASTVTVSATDALGQSVFASATVPACPNSLSSVISSSPLYSGNYSMVTVSLSSTVTGGEGGSLTYAWSGPGGWTSTSATPAPTFACGALPAEVTLTATNGSGHQVISSTIIAACPSPISVSASVGLPTITGNYVSQSLTLSGTVLHGTGPFSYSWSGTGTFADATSASTSVDLTCSPSATSETLSVTDALGQNASGTASVPACAAPINANISGTPLYSGNYSTETLSLSATLSGGGTGKTYAWSGPGGWTSTSATPAPSFTCSLLPSSISLTVTDVAGHAGTASLALDACPSPVSASASAGSPSYIGNYASQTVALTGGASGGVGSYTYGWSGSNSTFSPSSAAQSPSLSLICSSSATTETVSATDTNGQSNSATVSIAACPSNIGANVVGTPLYSGNYSLDTVSLSATPSGGQAPYTYAWSGPGSWTSTAATPAPSFACSALPSTVNLTITDSTGHAGSSSVAIVACPSPVSASASAGSSSYVGNYASQTVALTGGASGGVGSYTYGWSGSNSTFTPSATAQNPSLSLTCSASDTTETVSATDTNGQSSSATVSIAACPSNIGANVVGTPLYSGNYSLDTVSLSATPSGGQAPYTYAWSGPGAWTSSATTPAPSFACTLLPSTANLTITDSSGHAGSSSVAIAACPTPVSASASAGSPSYVGNYASQTVALTGGASGGVGSYDYSWSGTNSTFTPSASVQSPSLSLTCSMSATTETLTATDTNGQSASGTASIAACPNAITATTTGTPLYSGNYSLDTVSLSATTAGGQGALTYAWSGPSSWTSTAATPAPTFNCSALPYTVTLTVSDTAGHQGNSSVAVAACPSPLSASASAGSPTYVGNYVSQTVALTGGATGGVTAYTWSWSGANSTFTPSAASQSPSLSLTCSASATTETLNILDANGQPASSTVNIPACPSPINVTINAPSKLYSGDYSTLTDTFSVTVSGGNGALTYAWTGPAPLNGSTSATPAPTFTCSALASSPSAGVTVTDASLFTGTATLTLPACPSPVGASASAGTPTYVGNYASQTVALTGGASGGSGSYTYGWAGANSTFSPSAASLSPSLSLTCSGSATIETITVTDSNGQSHNATVSIAGCPGSITATVTGTPLYSGNYSLDTVSLSSVNSGGAGSYTYAWSGPGSWTSTIATPAPTFSCSLLVGGGTVTLIVTDTSGHSSGTSSVTIAACPSALSGTASAGTPTYVGNYTSQTATLTGTASGGSGSYTYSWAGANSTFTPSSTTLSPNLSLTCSASATTETLTISDSSGQNFSPTVSIAACPAAFSAAATKGLPTYTLNYGNAAYTLTATPTGGSGTMTYAWTGPAPLSGSTSATPTSIFACTALASSPSATVTITDGHGKTAQGSVTLPACPTPITATASAGSPAYSGNYSLDNITFGTVASGGSGTLTYLWTGPSSLSGSTIAAPSPSLTCSALTGSPTAYVTVSDGTQSVISNTLTIAACPGVIAATTPTITSRTYNADDSSTTLILSASASGGTGSITYSWSTTASGGTITWTAGTTTTPTVVIPSLDLQSGTQTISFTATDSLGQVAITTITVAASPTACGS